MPIARFQMPDGRVARFEVPEGTTPEKATEMMQTHFSTSGQPSPLVGGASTSQDSQAALKETLGEAGWAERNLAGMGSALAKTYYGGKQLLKGGTLSPEDQQAVKDWSTIEQEAPAGAIAGNIGMMVAPGMGLAGTGGRAAMLGKTLLTPSTALKSAAVGAGYTGLQPTAEQGAEGLQQRGIEAVKGGALGAAGYGAAKGLSRLIAPKGRVIPAQVPGGASQYISPNADEIARMELLKKMPVPITEQDVIRSQITRKYPQQEAERLVAGQPFIGEELTARLARGQEKMLANIDELQKKMGAKAPSAEQAGETVRTWMQNIYGAAKEDTTKAYNYARQLHGDKQYIPKPEIVNTLIENRAMPGYRELFSQAKNMGLIVPKSGGGFTGGRVTVNDLDKFKVMANQVAQSSDGTTRYAGGDIVNKVYSQLDDVAPEFKQAAQMRKRQGMIFESPKVTQKILGTTEGRFGAAEQELGGVTIPNYQVPSEKLIDSITKGSVEDLRYIRNLVVKGTNQQREYGMSAIKEMRGSVLDGMKGVWTSTQTPQAKANQINKYFDKIGDEKIRILFGASGAKQIEQFRKAAEIMNKAVPSPEGGSQTAGRLMMMGNGLFNVLERIPIAGAPIAKGAKIIKDIGVSSAAKRIPQIPSNLSSLARRQEIASKLSDLAPYAGLAAIGVGQ